MVKVKVCGITNVQDAQAAQDAGADFLGFVFAESPRRVTPERAGDIVKRLKPSVKIVALFVNEPRERVAGAIKTIGRVDLLQFHGDETPEYCRHFDGKRVIKAFRVKDETFIEEIKAFRGIGFVLLDAFREGRYGGTGKAFDWGLADRIGFVDTPVFISGGLNPGNVKEAVQRFRPFCVDVSSGVEKEPGKKERQKLIDFIRNAKSI